MSSLPPDFRIDEAVESDLPLIMALILELAEFEKLEHEAMASEADMRSALFGARRYAEVVIARVDQEPAGFALFFHNFSTFLGKPGIYLEDLYVKLPWRGKGCGAALLQYVARQAVSRGCNTSLRPKRMRSWRQLICAFSCSKIRALSPAVKKSGLITMSGLSSNKSVKCVTPARSPSLGPSSARVVIAKLSQGSTAAKLLRGRPTLDGRQLRARRDCTCRTMR